MKKRIVSLIVLCAMLISTIAISTVGVSAVSTHDGRTAVYATTKPTIDGVKDPIYDTATAMKGGSRGNLRMLWDETGIYIFAQIFPYSDKSVIDIYISGKAYTMGDAQWWWDSWASAGDYYFRYKSDGTISAPAGGFNSHYRTPAGMQAKTATRADGFDVEFYIPMKSSDWNIGNGAGNSFLGFGAMFAGNWYFVSEFTKNTNPTTQYKLNAIRLDPNPCTHESTVYTETAAPSCTETGTESGTCPTCGKELNRTVDELGHDLSETATVDVEPTLIAKGEQSHHCSRCDATENPSEIDETTIQYVGVQTTDVTDGAYNARFLAQIADLKAFRAAGFEVSLSYGKTLDTMCEPAMKALQTTDAYTSIQAGNGTATPNAEDGGKYLIAVPITDIPVTEDIAYVTFVIKPFTVSAADGSIIYATGTDSWTITLHNGVVVE